MQSFELSSLMQGYSPKRKRSENAFLSWQNRKKNILQKNRHKVKIFKQLSAKQQKKFPPREIGAV